MTFRLGPCRDPVLLTNDDQPNRAWACGDCGAIYGGGLGEKTAREHCAQRICDCGQVLKRHHTICVDCLMLSEMEQRDAELKKALATAEHVRWQDYNSEMQICSPTSGDFYPDADTLLDNEEDIGLEEPWLTTWAWACTVKKLHVDARDVAQAALKGHDDEACINDKATEDLQELLDAWCEKRHLETFFPDYKRIVTFNDLVQERRAELEDALKEGDEDMDEDEVSEGK